MEITKEEFQAWKENKVTMTITQGLVDIQNDLKDFLGNGGTIAKDSTISTDFIVGRIQGLNEVLNIEYEEPVKDYGH